MMKVNILKIAATVLFAFCFAFQMTAQEDKYKSLKLKAAQKVAQLNDYISFMADKGITVSDKQMYKDTAKKLFIKDCGPFMEIIEYNDGSKETINRNGVIMEVVSLRNRTPRKRPMLKYFDGLIQLNYKSIKIETTDIVDMEVTEPQKLDDGNYVCSVYFDQAWESRTREGGTYREITRKWVVCYIKEVTVISNDEDKHDEKEYIIELGDVHVESIHKV